MPILRQIYKKLYDIWKCLTGKAQHASNSNYKIERRVYKILSEGEITADRILKVDNKYQREILHDICVLANKRKAGEFAENAQITKMKDFMSVNTKFLTTEFLDRVEQIAMSSGLFVSACAMREKNEALMLGQADRQALHLTKRNAVKLFWCYIKRGEDDKAKQLLEASAIKKSPFTYSIVRELCMALRLLPRDFHTTENNPENKAFADYVRGKKIAIIGPAPSEIDHNEEIKRNFDIIIRMSYRGLDGLPENERELGVQISYYNSVKPLEMLLEQDMKNSFLEDLDFVVVKARNKHIQRHKLSRFTKVRFALYSGTKFFFLGKHNLLQIILQDLSNYSPSCIKIFYANLFLSDSPYDKEYMTSVQKRHFEGGRLLYWVEALAKHNIISQYDYVRQLYCRGIIEADTRLSEILELGVTEYVNHMEKLENQHGA